MAEHEGRALGCRQRPERSVDRVPLVAGLPCVRGAGGLDLVDDQSEPAALLALEVTEVIGELVPGDRAEPRGHVGSAVEGRAPARRLDERLLGELLRE